MKERVINRKIDSFIEDEIIFSLRSCASTFIPQLNENFEKELSKFISTIHYTDREYVIRKLLVFFEELEPLKHIKKENYKQDKVNQFIEKAIESLEYISYKHLGDDHFHSQAENHQFNEILRKLDEMLAKIDLANIRKEAGQEVIFESVEDLRELLHSELKKSSIFGISFVKRQFIGLLLEYFGGKSLDTIIENSPNLFNLPK